MLVDYETGAEYAPLAHLDPDQAKFWIYDSLLSEYAALGFEYGYSVVEKEALVGWEAQFGDFVNGAQIIIDQYLVAAEDKWGQQSGLVMLLPHGYEGQGPEHSSARIERFLTLCAEDNIQVANCYDRGAVLPPAAPPDAPGRVRKPLIVFTPKSLLRAKVGPLADRRAHARAASRRSSTIPTCPTTTASRAAGGAGERQGRPRGAGPARQARRRRSPSCASSSCTRGRTKAWPPCSSATRRRRELVWLQEEPENMGAWNFVKGRLYEALGDEYTIRRVSRPESGSPATGSHAVHVQEQDAIVAAAVLIS